MAASHLDLPVLLHNDKRGLLTVEDGRLDVLQLSKDGRPPKRLLTCPLRNFLLARLAQPQTSTKHGENRRLDLHALPVRPNGSGTELRLTKLHVLVEPVNSSEAEAWVDNIMQTTYNGLQASKRVLLLVNPVGGKGKAKSIVHNTVIPILEAAGCQVDLRETTHRLHAEQIAATVDLIYDVIATASGDGLVYEVLNGLASRPDAKKALQIPVAPIPTGSANAVCTNLFGVKDTFNIPLACLNLIKGRKLNIDLCSVLLLPSMERRFAFLSQALGLMVDLDIGTEHLRWMGDTRFMVGFLKGIVNNKSIKCRIRLNVVEHDKVSMARKARDKVKDRKGTKTLGGGRDPLVKGIEGLKVTGKAGAPGVEGSGKKTVDGTASSMGPSATQPVNGLANGDTDREQNVDGNAEDDFVPDHGPIPPARPLEPDASWVTIEALGEKPDVKLKRSSEQSAGSSAVGSADQKKGSWIDGQGILYFYAGMMPWVARDLMQWPVAISGDGLVDVVVQSVVPRMMMANAITGAEKGEAYWLECQHYYKVSAYTVENLDKANQPIFTMDGESFEWDSFHVEVHPRIANLLSLDGDFYVSEFLQKHDTK
ncbi:hypothetical protein IAU60_003361 [Kwoniella sp. DSM 27419]